MIRLRLHTVRTDITVTQLCGSMMFILKTFRLVFDTNNSCFIEINTKTNNSIKKYKSPNEAGIFKTYFEDLQNMAGKELQRMKNILNDSRNYNQRIGADIINDTIHIFLEDELIRVRLLKAPG